MNSRVAILRLITGEEILTEVLPQGNDPNNNALKIKNPVQIVVMPSRDDPNTPKVALAPWIQFAAKKEHLLPMASVVLDYEPITEFVNQYKSIHGGIQVSPQKLILP